MANVANKTLENKSGNQPEEFYQSKIQTMKFFFTYELIKTKGLAKTLMNKEELTIKAFNEIF